MFSLVYTCTYFIYALHIYVYYFEALIYGRVRLQEISWKNLSKRAARHLRTAYVRVMILCQLLYLRSVWLLLRV